MNVILPAASAEEANHHRKSDAPVASRPSNASRIGAPKALKGSFTALVISNAYCLVNS